MSNINMIRLAKFAGLNKTDEPHSIADNEFSDMKNIFLNKRLNYESRKGYTPVGEIASTGYIRAIWTAAWSPTDDRLYYVTLDTFGKMDSDGSTTAIESMSGHREVSAFRYKDKMLVLPYGDYLYWYDSDESLELIKYPQFKYTAASGTLGQSSGSGTYDPTPDIEDGKWYQYSISVQLGDVGEDGETANASPADDYWTGGVPYSGLFIQGDYANAKITTAGRFMEGDDLEYKATMHGFEVYAVNLWRREAYVPDPSLDMVAKKTSDRNWMLLDTATLSRAGDTYYMDSNVNSVFYDVDGSYDSTTDVLTLTIDFNDAYASKYEDVQPYEEAETVNPKACFAARLHNRIFLANIVSSDSADCKKVYYSYRGLHLGGTTQEIGGYTYGNPMLIYPYDNHFYCDAEDIEDPITGIGTFQNNVMIFTERCTFLWREDMMEPVKMANDIGCIAHDTIREFEGKLIWLAHTGVYQYDGTSVKNLTYEKAQDYIDDMQKVNAWQATAAVYDRKYFLSAPFESSANDYVLVYDFDLKTWHPRRYTDANGNISVKRFYVDYDGFDEFLYAGYKEATGATNIAVFEDGYTDDGENINFTFKTKYFSMKAPDITKIFRKANIHIEDFFGDVTMNVYVDDLDTAKQTVTFNVEGGTGFILDDAVYGILDTSTFGSWTDENMEASLERGLKGSRIQIEVDGNANSQPAKIHSMGLGWLPVRRLKTRYGA